MPRQLEWQEEQLHAWLGKTINDFDGIKEAIEGLRNVFLDFWLVHQVT